MTIDYSIDDYLEIDLEELFDLEDLFDLVVDGVLDKLLIMEVVNEDIRQD